MKTDKADSDRTAAIAVGAGAFLLTVAVMVPWYAAPQMKKVPLDLAVTTVSSADATVLDQAALLNGVRVADTGVPVVAQRHVTVEEPSDADSATMQAGLTIRRIDKPGDAGLLSASIDTVTIDRSTGMPIEGSVGTIQTSMDAPAAEVVHDGLQYKFPFDVQKQTYPYFDLNMRESFPLDFVEEDEIDGVAVYRFHQKIGPADTINAPGAPGTTLSLPASTWGLEGTELVTMHRIYSTDRDIWVEPVTGLVITGSEHVRQAWGASPDDPNATVFLEMTTEFDEETVADQLVMARKYHRLIVWGTEYLPIGAAVIGAALLAFGIRRGIRGSQQSRTISGEVDSAAADLQVEPSRSHS